jgi:FkbM family methyltransferase
MTPTIVRVVDLLTRRRINHLGAWIVPDRATYDIYTRAELFWGIFERSECLYIQRHLQGASYTVELGSGLGVASTHIARGMTDGGTMVCVEANPAFIPAIAGNLESFIEAGRIKAEIVNAAISDLDSESVFYVEPNPFRSHLAGEDPSASATPIPVPARTLRAILEERQPEFFDLVCDIEGGESAFILGGDSWPLEMCRRMVIELHPCSWEGRPVTEDDLLQALHTRWGFNVIERKGPVVALARHASPLAVMNELTSLTASSPLL